MAAIRIQFVAPTGPHLKAPSSERRFFFALRPSTYIPCRTLSEIPGPHDPVTDHGESAEEEGADDPTNGWIPDHMGVSTVRWAHDHLAEAEQCPTNIPRRAPTKARSTMSHSIGAGPLSMPSYDTQPYPCPVGCVPSMFIGNRRGVSSELGSTRDGPSEPAPCVQ